MLAAIMAVLVLALSACAGLPTSGSVQAGLAAGDDAAPDIQFRPNRPQAGATPLQIVQGFIRAGSGTADSWEIARLYLAPEIRATWKPEAGVIIDVLGDRQYDEVRTARSRSR